VKNATIALIIWIILLSCTGKKENNITFRDDKIGFKYAQINNYLKRYILKYSPKDQVYIHVLQTHNDTIKLLLTQLKKPLIENENLKYLATLNIDNSQIFIGGNLNSILKTNNKLIDINQYIFDPPTWRITIVNDSCLLDTLPKPLKSWYKFLPPEPKPR
jgi:hypothetical protein